MRNQHRLGPLQMRIRWHRRSSSVAFSANNADHLAAARNYRNAFANVQTQISSDLLVPAASSVKLTPDLADALD